MSTILIAIIALAALAAVFGAILGFASIRFKVEADPIVDQIDSILPQTQCGQCGYPGCRPYAEAIANGDKINKCPPGGQATIEKLADLMGQSLYSNGAVSRSEISQLQRLWQSMNAITPAAKNSATKPETQLVN